MFVTPKTERDKKVKTFRQPPSRTQNSYIAQFNSNLNYIENICTFANSILSYYKEGGVYIVA